MSGNWSTQTFPSSTLPSLPSFPLSHHYLVHALPSRTCDLVSVAELCIPPGSHIDNTKGRAHTLRHTTFSLDTSAPIVSVDEVITETRHNAHLNAHTHYRPCTPTQVFTIFSGWAVSCHQTHKGVRCPNRESQGDVNWAPSVHTSTLLRRGLSHVCSLQQTHENILSYDII